MIGRYDAAINGVWLSELDDSLIVKDIREERPKSRTETADKAIGLGLRFIRNQRQSLSVTVSFVLWEQDVGRRKNLLMRVQEWAMGAVGRIGYLEINDRRGQRLNVRVDELPPLASAMKWQDEISITFTAYELPYWMSIDPARAQISESGLMHVPGIGETVCEVDVRNDGDSAITRVQINASTTCITFDGISLAKGEHLIVSYDDFGRICAKIGDESVLSKRTADSDDDLLVRCGDYNPLMIFSDGVVNAEFKARGVYL